MLIFFVLLGLGMVVGSFTTITRVESRTYPIFIGSIIAFLSFIELFFEIKRINKKAPTEQAPKKKKVFISWPQTLLFIFSYAFIIWLAGFLVGTWLATFYCYWVLSEKRNKIILFAFPTVLSGLIFVVFTQFFYVRLPLGIIFQQIL